MQRRTFLKSTATLGVLGAVRPIDAFGSGNREKYNHFGVHAFVDEHPDAVFIMKTDVDIKTNSEAKKETGTRFSRSVMLPMDETGQ